MKKFFVSAFLFVSAFVFSFSAGALVSASENTGNTEEVSADVMTEIEEFEGDLLYRSDEVHSKAIRMFSNGTAYNGERTQLVTVSPFGLRIQDLDLHVSVVVLPEMDAAYIYSDITKEGYMMTIDQLRQLYSALDVDYSPYPGETEFTKTGGFIEESEVFEYEGDKCRVSRGLIKSGDISEAETEIWISDSFSVPDVFRYFMYGYNPGGVVKKFILNIRMDIPIIGHADSMVASELVAVEERIVEVDELFPPSDIIIKRLENVGKLSGFYKANNKELKKRGLKVETKKGKAVKRSISEKWDFADQWFEKQVDSETASRAERNLAESFNNLMDNLSELARKNGAERNDEGDSSEAETHEDELYIPDVVHSLQHTVLHEELRQNEINRMHNDANRRFKKVQIGTKFVEVTVADGMRPTLDRVSRESKESVVADNARIANMVINYGVRNKTDYIPKDVFNKMYKGIHDASLQYLKDRNKANKERVKRNYSGLYSHYVSMLSSHYHFDRDRDLKWIHQCQTNMKKLREKCGCKKSKWEDWDGFEKMD